MSEKINVVCEKCGAGYRAYDDQLHEIECPECGGKLVPDKDEKPGKDEVPKKEGEKNEGVQGEKVEKEEEKKPKPDDKKEPGPTKEQKEKEEAAEKKKSPRAPVKLDEGDLKGIEQISKAHKAILDELDKVIVGQKEVIEEIVIAIMASGHCLLEGVPGLAKTLLISSLAKALSLTFKRIQFTPDLMPTDITGTEIIHDNPETGSREFKFLQGPIFSNIVLADEINRTPPKTQAAMLEAMQEKQVSIGGEVRELPEPFFVLATQNPLEQEGTYPLPEAQQDRFLFKIFVDYPEEDEEKRIIEMVSGRLFGQIDHVLSAEDILSAQSLVSKIPVADTVIEYATKIVRATRLNREGAPDFVNKWVAWGCGPRASISLINAAKAYAALSNASHVSCEHVARVAHPVMRHRLAVNYTARAEGVSTDDVVDKLLDTIPKY